MNEDRRAAIIWLLEHRNDHLPQPTRIATASGFVGGKIRTLSCPDCLANDRVMFGCETCGGNGQIPDDRKDPMDDPLKDPPPDPRRKIYWGGNSRVEDAAWRDRELSLLAHQIKAPRSEQDLLAEANQRGYAWEEQRRSLYRNTDLAALDRSLDRLRSHDTDAAHALNMVYVDGWLLQVGDITPLIEVLCDRGIRFLSLCLPDPVRAGGDHKHPALIRRDRRREAA